jgi:hypothetical protein
MQSALATAISAYGAATTAKFAAGGGEPEDQLRGPFEMLVRDLADLVPIAGVVLVGEHHLADDRIRPDYAVHVGGALVGFVEIKAPGKGADPRKFKGHDRKQWERLACLPNVLYTDGDSFGLYRDGELVGDIIHLSGSVESSGSDLAPPESGSLTALIEDFTRWQPIAPRRPKELAGIAARLCRLLRAEVLELLATDEGLQALADDWRRVLFPNLTEAEFADAYAQTVTFGLLLTRVEGIPLDADDDLHDVAVQLGQHHTLVGRALDLLTDSQVLEKLAVSVTTLRRVLAVVDWPRISKGREAAWLYFYEEFLEEYDPALRKATGSYYTPVEVVDGMVRLVDDLLRTRLGHAMGFASPGVEVVDPATGSGTFLLRIIEHIANAVAVDEGDGAVPARLVEAARRLIGFELQAGPYSVAELRLSAEYARQRAALAASGLRLYLADTLSNPFEADQKLGAQYLPIARSRQQANNVKATERVVVVIGNPPYKNASKGRGGWIETGARDAGQAAPLADFVPPKEWKVSAHVKHLYNPYVYFWRWATWKVFDGHPGDRGVVAFITVAGFLAGPGFGKMRDYLRRTADALWVIDCSPEGHQPEVSTRIFQGVQQPVCIVLAIKDGTTDSQNPAPVKFTSIAGHRTDKFRQLATLGLDGAEWVEGPNGWTDPLAPAPTGGWSAMPALEDLVAWSGSGTMPGRTWVASPSSDALRARWRALIDAPPEEKTALLAEHARDRTIRTVLGDNLPGYEPKGSLEHEADESTPLERVGYRSFDRQWIVADKRVINQPNPGLWQVRRAPGQVFLTAPHDRIPTGGPSATFTDLVPDLHHYHGRGGRAVPLWLDSAGSAPNVVPGLLEELGQRYGRTVTGADLFGYVAAVLASPAYLGHYAADLSSPGLRVPLTADGDLFGTAVEVGMRVLWLHSYGERFADPSADRPSGPPRLPEVRRPLIVQAIPHDEAGMPKDIEYDSATRTLHVGAGEVAPVEPTAWAYEVSGMRVVKRWFDRRKKDPDGRRSSPLDDLVPRRWEASWSTELLELINVLTLLADLEPEQEQLLDAIAEGPLVSVADLTDAGVLPVGDRPTVEQPPKPGRDTLPGF